jgi:hypothetical protein
MKIMIALALPLGPPLALDRPSLARALYELYRSERAGNPHCAALPRGSFH